MGRRRNGGAVLGPSSGDGCCARTIASRSGEWGDLLAATFATVAVAIPMLFVAAAWETLVRPEILWSASPVLA